MKIHLRLCVWWFWYRVGQSCVGRRPVLMVSLCGIWKLRCAFRGQQNISK